ncbi:hypothetical protein SOCEGT47_056770 [Sorangium cellulosum]|uniref:RNA polymerase sigma factor 70 region 4 type 2 domain-containing protein n=2 Tax=Sorangium cellulosum TaxID=56 RepID=A0A4P2Q7Y4_SORCE|nr:hypothetical protein SOCEGT47_056770 [Sorangium cellulosum]
MSKRRRGAKRPPAAQHPPAFPSIEALMAEQGLIVGTLIKSGVPRRDRADVAQQVLLGAWQSVKRGMYRPDPRLEPRVALRNWLRGVAWRNASHYVLSAYVRHSIIHPEPLGLRRDILGPSLEAQILARDMLEVLVDLKAWQREILLALDDPESLVQYAKRRGLNPSTAASRLRIARKALAQRLRRWRR